MITGLLPDCWPTPSGSLRRSTWTAAEHGGQAYTTLLDEAGAADAWNNDFRPVLGPLAVAGSGTVLPLPLLVRASEALNGPKGENVRTRGPQRLRGLVLHRDVSTPVEHVGLFHPTMTDYLLGPSASSAGYAIDAAVGAPGHGQGHRSPGSRVHVQAETTPSTVTPSSARRTTSGDPAIT